MARPWCGILRAAGLSAPQSRRLSKPLSPLVATSDFTLQRRTAVFTSATGTGPIGKLHEEVAEVFAKRAKGRPPLVTTAQLVQILFEVGAVSAQTSEVNEVLNRLMVRGFYRQSHPQKRDSYGPAPLPLVGLAECKRWAMTLFLEELKRREQHAVAGGSSPSKKTGAGTRRPSPSCSKRAAAAMQCRAIDCGCGPFHCALVQRPWNPASASSSAR